MENSKPRLFSRDSNALVTRPQLSFTRYLWCASKSCFMFYVLGLFLYIDNIKSVIQSRNLLTDETTVLKVPYDPGEGSEVIFYGDKTHLKKLDNKTVRYLDTPFERKGKVK